MDPGLRDEILRRIDEGKTNAQIASELGIKQIQIAAVKAHRTMGTYDSVPARATKSRPPT